MKQTAVEWLVEEILYKSSDGELWNGFTECVDLSEYVAKAKEMEKEQIMDAHIEGQRVFDKHPHTQWNTDQSEQYYTETYGGGQ